MKPSPEAFARGLTQLESIPSVAVKVIEVAGRDDSSLDELGRLIESDQTLASKVLKAANSTFIGYPRQVQTLRRALTLLGLDMVRCLALSMVISKLYLADRTGRARGFLNGLWNHSLACAVTSELLAAEGSDVDPKVAFVAGLLHDIGKLVLLQWDWTVYSAILDRAGEGSLSLDRLEHRELGTSHCQVGSQLLSAWGFPQALGESILNHHVPSKQLQDDPQARLTMTVKCANGLCHLVRLGESGNRHPEMFYGELEEATRLTPERIRRLTLRVLERFNESAALFDLEEGTASLYVKAAFHANEELAQMYQRLIAQRRKRLEAEAELRRRDEELNRSRRLEAIGQLAGGVAHDFNNLLTIIKGHLELATARVAPDDPLLEHLREIGSASSRAAALTEQLLTFGRRQTPRPMRVNPNTVIEGMTSVLQQLLGDSVELVLDLDPAAGEVWADPSHMEQVLVNLALNSRDAMPEGGRFSLQTRRIPPDASPIEALTEDAGPASILMRISDTGTGMSPDVRKKAFEPFFTTKDVGKGTGLGLSSVYGSVIQAGGKIELKSRPGRGTEVEIHLPVHDPGDSPHQTANARPPPASSHPPGVLLVESDGGMLELMNQALHAHGFQVFESTSAEEAEDLFARHSEGIDILVADIVMPGLGGKALYRRLRQLRPELKVVYTAEYAQELDEDVSGTPLLRKPFSPNHLVERIWEALESG
jgi:putative nucleotidyltransferase with HDIG domain